MEPWQPLGVIACDSAENDEYEEAEAANTGAADRRVGQGVLHKCRDPCREYCQQRHHHVCVTEYALALTVWSNMFLVILCLCALEDLLVSPTNAAVVLNQREELAKGHLTMELTCQNTGTARGQEQSERNLIARRVWLH